MKTSADKSSTTTSTPVKKVASSPFFAPAVQMKMAVSKPGDKLEQEADRMADKVMRMPSPVTPSSGKEEKLQKAPAIEDKLQRQGADVVSVAGSNVQSAIQSKRGGGQPLSNDVRRYMEPRFNADFSKVRVHSDQESTALNNRLSARAFTYQNNIFFSRNQYQPGSSEGKQLLAHELTHTIQQGHAVQRTPQVSANVTQPQIQRSALGDILNWFADKANYIPGFRMLTVILGMNPVNMSTVERSAPNILRALIEFMPGGALITQALDNHGIFTKVATWIDGKIKALGMVGQMFKNALTEFIDSLGLSDLAPWNWGDVWNRAKRIFTAPIDRLISFAKGVITDILKMVKDAILKPLAGLAQGTRGYDLLKAVLGEDPITGEAVPRNADTLIGGFMKLIGQEEIWENIKKGNAIARAWAWFQGALGGLRGLVRSIPGKIIETLTSLTFVDIITVVGAFIKVVKVFASIAGDFLRWGLDQVISLLEILFSVVAPGVMPYIKKARAAFITIIKNPVAFVGNLVRAGRLGFQMFASNIWTHLKTALIKWITGPLGEAGVYIPKSFDLKEIVKLVLSVLGLTWQNIRGKLVKIIPEPVLAGLEKTAGILVTLVKDGPVAAWEQIKVELGELKEQLIGKVTEMISTEVVKAAVTKLVSMLNPAGAVIQAIIAIYNTVTFFIQKIQQIAAVVTSFVDSIAAIASGQVDAAAKKVEQAMANTLTVIIAFLAKFVGIGNIPEKIVGIVKKIRQPIDKGLDKIVAWLGKMLAKAKDVLTEWWKSKKPFTTKGGATHEIYYSGKDKSAVPMVASKDPGPIEKKLADFRSQATAADASDIQKKALDKITKTLNLLKLSPDDPFIVSNMKELFEIFDEESDSPLKQWNYQPKGQTLSGDSTIVGASMRIDWLSADFIKQHPGSPPGSGQNALMNKLVVDPKKRSAFKYVRGHLLNENLGGKGENQNLFPITANANSQHLQSTESEVKNWIVPKDKQKKKKYALYEVTVAVKNVNLDEQKEQNHVDSTFHCRVVLKDESGKEAKSFLTSIDSTYQEKETASRFDLTTAKKG